jgi:putative ABC transport system permease protein
MNIRELLEFLKIAVNALRLNKLRSALTALGIIIGVASVIVMAAIGNGASRVLETQVASLGTRVINVNPGAARIGGRSSGFGGAPPLSEKDLRAVREGIPGIAAISGSLEGSVSVVFGAANWSTTGNGVHAEYQDVRPWPLAAGRFFNAEEVKSGAKVVVLGASVVREIFDSSDPIGEIVRVNNIPFEVIGVLTTRGFTGGRDADDVVMAPITTARSRLVGRRYATVPDTVGGLVIRVADDADMNATQDAITTVIRRQRRIGEREEDNFSVRNYAELLQTFNAQQETLKVLLATTAAMSLVVGGIGIMNIMLVSVTERTREIGLRMAVGARGIDVMAQFLTEAIILCLAGGLVGLLIGVTITVLISMLAGWTVAIGVGTVVMAILVSAGVGIIFGFVPARRAARLNPIDALRYE